MLLLSAPITVYLFDWRLNPAAAALLGRVGAELLPAGITLWQGIAMPLALAARERWIAQGANMPAAQQRVALAMAGASEWFETAAAPAEMISEGRGLLLENCLRCHDVRRIIRERLAKRGRKDFTSTGPEKDRVGR